MATAIPGTTSLLGSLRSLGDGLLATVQERIELFALELEEERFRLIQIFIWVSAAIFAGVMALLSGTLLLVHLWWESARLAVLGGLTIFYVGALVAIIAALRRLLVRAPQPFAATLRAIGDDRACIRNEN